MPVIRVGDIDMYHERKGQGPALVMIQGLGYDHRPYLWLRDVLARRFDTILMDNRGVGLSSVPEGPYSIEQLAEDVRGLMDVLGIPRAHLMGVSMGGYVAQMLALDHPSRIQNLVLGCTCMTGDPARLQMPGSTLEILMNREGSPEQIARRGLRVAFSKRFVSLSPGIFEQLVRWRMDRPVTLQGYQAQLAAGMQFDVTERVSTIGHDTLIIHGDQDVVVPPGRGEELAEAIDGARLHVMEGAGHLFFIEEAEQTARVVTRFLDPEASS